jgi:hypothetical protein
MRCIWCRTVCTTGNVSCISTVSTSRSQQLAVIAFRDLPLVTLQSDLSAELNGVKLKDRNLIAEHLEQSHTHSLGQQLHRHHVVIKQL